MRVSELTEEIIPVEPEPKSPIIQSYPAPKMGSSSPRSTNTSPRPGARAGSPPLTQPPTASLKMEAPGRSQMEVPGRTSTSPTRPGGGDPSRESLERDIRDAVGLGLNDETSGNSLGEAQFGTDV